MGWEGGEVEGQAGVAAGAGGLPSRTGDSCAHGWLQDAAHVVRPAVAWPCVLQRSGRAPANQQWRHSCRQQQQQHLCLCLCASWLKVVRTHKDCMSRVLQVWQGLALASTRVLALATTRPPAMRFSCTFAHSQCAGYSSPVFIPQAAPFLDWVAAVSTLNSKAVRPADCRQGHFHW